MKVEKERASQMIATLRSFARKWPQALVFAIENEGPKAEGFKNDRRSAAVCSRMSSSLCFYNRKCRSDKRGLEASPLCGHLLVDDPDPLFFLTQKKMKVET